MNRTLLIFFFCLLAATGYAQNKFLVPPIHLPNGWSVTPIGRSLPLGDLPLNLVVSPDKNRVAVTNNGQSKQTIQLFDAVNEKMLSQITVPKAWLGLQFSHDGEWLFATGGNDNRVLIYSTLNGQLALADSIALGKPMPTRIWPTGLDLNGTGNTLFVVTKEDSALYVCDVVNKSVTKRVPLPAEAYTCLYSAKNDELYISLWGGDQVLIVDPTTYLITASIPTGSHPNDLVLSRDGKTLYVACSNDNSVSVIDVKAHKVLESLNTALFPDAPAGSTPNGLALTTDQKTLLVANADNNCLAVFDVSKPGQSMSTGFIPTGWYPTAVKVIGSTVWVANGKGYASRPNPRGPNPYKGRPDDSQYSGSMFKGTLSLFTLPEAAELLTLSKQVYVNTPYTKDRETVSLGEENNPIPRRVGETSPIKHVFYIIKENRTYDQVFGDIAAGNGDSTLCLFPEKITPNQHALAREFVLLDNFYVDA